MKSEYEIEYIRSRRSRGISVVVQPGGKVLVRFPFFSTRKSAEKFLEKKKNWIGKAVARRKDMIVLPNPTKSHFLSHKETARKLIIDRLAYFNIQYRFTWQMVRMGRQKSRWGSCSRHGTLSFNYLLLFLPPALLDYVVVHELCHLKEFNHSEKFWDLVAKTIPEWRKLRKELKRYQTR